MTPAAVGPLSRPFSVARLPQGGADASVEASPEERVRLAADFGLVALESLTGRFHVTEGRGTVLVAGQVDAVVVQTCVVTLDEFSSALSEEVEVEFRAPAPTGPRHPAGEEIEADLDAPDELLGDRIDLGAITAEFLALGLDPHPRKPGAEFSLEGGERGRAETPFAALSRLRAARRDGEGDR